MKTITDWYKQGTGIPEAVKHFSEFITKELIKDPDIEFTDVSSDCCVTVNASILFISLIHTAETLFIKSYLFSSN